MAKMSRTEKYKELRESLQSDFGEGLSTKQLSEYENRLAAIDADNFSASNALSASDAGAHIRREMPADEAETDEIQIPEIAAGSSDPDSGIPTLDLILGTVAEEPSDDDDYLDHVISEVKKYNIDQGNAISENTQVNILRAINVDETEIRPVKSTKEPSYKKDTADIPFISTFSERTSSIPEIVEEPEVSKEKTVADISAEVFSMMEEDPIPSITAANIRVDDTAEHSNSIEVGFPSAQASRQQVLNQTMQMRNQLDEYEDSIGEITERMHHTNRILNIVLVTLILALLIVLAVVLWMIFTTN